MVSSDILFIGVGQAGGNLVDELLGKNRRIAGICINTNAGDVEVLTNITTKPLIFPNAVGAGRDRDTAKSYLADASNTLMLMDTLESYLNTKKHIYIAFSSGGGTGSGLTPAILALMARQRPDIQFNLVMMLPKNTESRLAHANTIECWNELDKLNNIGSIFLIDNNKRRKVEGINREFVRLFNEFLNSPNPNKNVVMDQKELSIIANAKGLMAIYDLNKYIDEPSDVIKDSIDEDSIFVLKNDRCSYVGLSVPEDFDVDSMFGALNPIEDRFYGIARDTSLMIVSGVPRTSNAISDIVEVYKKQHFDYNRNAIEDGIVSSKIVNVDLPIKNKAKKQITNKEEDKTNVEDLFSGNGDIWDILNNL